MEGNESITSPAPHHTDMAETTEKTAHDRPATMFAPARESSPFSILFFPTETMKQGYQIAAGFTIA